MMTRFSVAGTNGSRKKRLYVIAAATVLLVTGILLQAGFQQGPYLLLAHVVLLASYLLVGGGIIRTALKNLKRGKIFDENFLMSVATVGAIVINQFPEAVAVMLFYSIGEYFQESAAENSRRSIRALIDVRPPYANLKSNGEISRIRPEDVCVGAVIVVRPGEKVPLDGEVIMGESFVDTSALTGESVPRRVGTGQEVMSGMINGNGLLEVKVKRNFSESSAARILDLIEYASLRKARTEHMITSFSRIYTPAVVFGALALAVVPPLVFPGATFTEWAYRALVLLVISCPCALLASIPLGYFGGIGGCSRKGILVKGANYLDVLACLHTVVFDKTGTLTKGVFRVTEIVAKNGFRQDELLRLAAIAEGNSNHPIAASIREALGEEVVVEELQDYQEIAGCGIIANVRGRRVVCGNNRLMRRENVSYDESDADGTVTYLAVDGLFAGHIIIADEIKDDAVRAVGMLGRLGVKNIVMLTGDSKDAAERVAEILGIRIFFAELLPSDKVARVEEILAGLDSGQKLCFVGDGINDAPVLARADLGIAMGGLGSDTAIEAADVVIMDDRPSKLALAIKIARRTKRIVWQNIGLALGIKGFFIFLGSFGVATIWEAVFADVGVALLAIFNASRSLYYRDDAVSRGQALQAARKPPIDR